LLLNHSEGNDGTDDEYQRQLDAEKAGVPGVAVFQ
jgi:hypothetical protein